MNEVWIIALGIIDFQQTGRFSTYQIIILAILIYAFTYGKQDARRLDRFIQRKILELRGQPVPDDLLAKREEQLYGWAYTKKELKGFAPHILVFLSVQAFFAIKYGLSVEASTLAKMDFAKWGHYQLYGSQIASQIQPGLVSDFNHRCADHNFICNFPKKEIEDSLFFPLNPILYFLYRYFTESGCKECGSACLRVATAST